jgi:PEGA domain-containing protein
LTVIVVAAVGTVASFYARGYRFDGKTFKIAPNGLLVVNSDPNGAQIFVDGELNTATNATITLNPGTYDITLKKQAYLTWVKRITVDKEVVTQVDATLFPAVASLTPVTFSGAINPQVSPDAGKIAYADSDGLWVMETVNLPLGFNRQPRKITDANVTSDATWTWSPDSQQLLLTTKTGVFLLNTATITPQAQLVNISATKDKTLADWKVRRANQLTSLLSKLPDGLKFVFASKTTDVVFSPDETKILYTASASATIPSGLLPQLPGSSTQHEERSLKIDHKYVFDIKEDRNFEINDGKDAVYWFANSRNVVVPQKDRIVVMDYDGTNSQTLYAGSYIAPSAFATPNVNRLVILTNLGASNTPANLYSLNLK